MRFRIYEDSDGPDQPADLCSQITLIKSKGTVENKNEHGKAFIRTCEINVVNLCSDLA